MDRLDSGMNEALNTFVLESLYNKRIHTVLDFLDTDSKIIQRASNLTFKEINEVRRSLLKKFVPDTRNAFDLYQEVLTYSAIIPTGIRSLDSLLEGGLYTGNIYEICGLPSSGKTSFCLTLIRNVILKISDNIHHFDTKNDFSATKLKKLFEQINNDEILEALKRVHIQKITTRSQFLDSLYELEEKLQNDFSVKIIIVDSLPPLYNQNNDRTETNSFLNNAVNILRYISSRYHVTIVIINLLTLWNEGDFKNAEKSKEKIYCGNYWYNIPNVRLLLRKDCDTCKVILKKTFKVIPLVCECQVRLTDKGVI